MKYDNSDVVRAKELYKKMLSAIHAAGKFPQMDYINFDNPIFLAMKIAFSLCLNCIQN